MLYKAKTTLKTLAKAEVIHRKTTKEGRRSRDASSLHIALLTRFCN